MPLLLAQCTGVLEDCDIPRTLPWYFGLALFALWLATVAGVVLLARRRLAIRRERRARREERASRRGRPGVPATFD